jgi:signal transduction histidine kinase
MIIPFETTLVSLIALGNIILGALVFFKDPKNKVHRTFFSFTFFVTIWIISAFSSELSQEVNISLILSRIVYASTLLSSLSKDLFLQPWGFDLLEGPLYSVIVAYILILTCFAAYNLFSLYYKSHGRQRTQLIYFFLGFLIFIICSIVFNVVVRHITGTDIYYRFGNYSSIFLVAFLAYAIIRQKLFGIKVVLTTLLTALIAILLFVDIFMFSQTSVDKIAKSFILIIFLCFGYMLIKSVVREIRQRERMEQMAKELRETNIKLKKLDKAKSEFISIASHQLRTPLSAIIGYLSMVLEGVYGKINSKMTRPISNVFKASKQLNQLVNTLLNVSRIEAGKI